MDCFLIKADIINAAICAASAIPAVGAAVIGVAKSTKAIIKAKKAEKIASACRTVGKIGNTVAGMKATYENTRK